MKPIPIPIVSDHEGAASVPWKSVDVAMVNSNTVRCRVMQRVVAPWHVHPESDEMFYVLSGRGRAQCGGATYDMEKGDTLVLPPGMDHVVENVGTDRLYCLTVMVPNEGLAELIRAGAVIALDAEDKAVVS